jgi:hypothetical protein
VVAIHGLLVRKASRKTLYSALNMRPLPRKRITVLLCGLEERFCEFVVGDIPRASSRCSKLHLYGIGIAKLSFEKILSSCNACVRRAQSELAGGLIFAGGAARLAVHEAVFADADLEDGLAKNAELFALAGVFGLLALCALDFRVACSGAHAANLSRLESEGKMTLVTGRQGKSSVPRQRILAVPYNFQQ